MRVLLYDDNKAFRDSLAEIIKSLTCKLDGTQILDGTHCIEIVGCFPNPVNWAMQVRDSKPDIILMDIEMPELDGIQATSAIHKKYPSINIVMLTIFEEGEKLFKALRAGAVGYILKNSTPIRLIEAMREVHEKGGSLSPSIAGRVARFFDQSKGDTEPLTSREQETLKHLADGLSYKMIADRMGGISVETINSYMKSIYRKLHVSSGTGAVAKAIREGLV